MVRNGRHVFQVSVINVELIAWGVYVGARRVGERARLSIYSTNKWSFPQRRIMRASSPSSSTSSGSVYTSADDGRRCVGKNRSLDSEDVGTAWLLGSTRPSRDRSRILERFKIDKWVVPRDPCHEIRNHACHTFARLSPLAQRKKFPLKLIKKKKKKKLRVPKVLLLILKLELLLNMLSTIEVSTMQSSHFVQFHCDYLKRQTSTSTQVLCYISLEYLKH